MSKGKNIINEYAEYEDVSKNFYDRIIDEMNRMGFSKKDLKKLMKMHVQIKNIKTKRLSFVFYAIPEGAQRPRCSFKQKRFYVPNAHKFRKIFNDYVKENGLEYMIYTPCILTGRYYSPIPNTMNKYERILSEIGTIRNAGKPDWDNLGKTTDMFNKKLWIDDSLVVESHIYKYFSLKPRIEIDIDFLLNFESKYIERNKKASKVYKDMVKLGFIKKYDMMEV